MWDEKWPELDWGMMYDLEQNTEETRQRIVERYAHNIELRY
jgi:hypothetical protein